MYIFLFSPSIEVLVDEGYDKFQGHIDEIDMIFLEEKKD